MSHTPLHLTARDFDAYAPEKATSNAYSRPRLEVKQRALAWGKVVAARLAELGVSLDLHGSDEHPTLRNKKRVDCQWVFLLRDRAAREELDRLLDRGRSIADELDGPSPFGRHAFLALRIDAHAVEVCFSIPAEAKVDVDNLRALVSASDSSDDLLRALRALPEQFWIAVDAPERMAVGAVTLEALRAFVERLSTGHAPLRVGWSVAREQVIDAPAPADDAADDPARPPTVDEQLEDAIVALSPIYKLIAWSRDNDRVALERRIETADEERARAHVEAQAETERWEAERAESRRRAAEEGKARAAPSLSSLFQKRSAVSPVALGETPKPPHRAATLRRSEPPAPAVAVAAPVTPPQAESSTAPTVKAEPVEKIPVVEKGAKVRVLAGPFADKVGVVSDVDGRGGARVLLGLLSTRIEIASLEPVVEGRERPPLQSSHRRPLAPATRRAR